MNSTSLEFSAFRNIFMNIFTLHVGLNLNHNIFSSDITMLVINLLINFLDHEKGGKTNLTNKTILGFFVNLLVFVLLAWLLY